MIYEDNDIYYITYLQNGNILITGIEFASISIYIYEGIFFMLLIIGVVVIANIFITKKTSDKIISAFSSINSHLKMINEEEYDSEVLKELMVFDDTSKQPSRITCATLSAGGIKEFLEK